MVEADEGDLDSDDEASASLGQNTSEDEADEAEEEKKSGSGSNHPSDADSAFMDDVFNQLGGFEVGDYGEEDEEEQLDQPV
jgi:archaellum component FlaC